MLLDRKSSDHKPPPTLHHYTTTTHITTADCDSVLWRKQLATAVTATTAVRVVWDSALKAPTWRFCNTSAEASVCCSSSTRRRRRAYREAVSIRKTRRVFWRTHTRTHRSGQSFRSVLTAGIVQTRKCASMPCFAKKPRRPRSLAERKLPAREWQPRPSTVLVGSCPPSIEDVVRGESTEKPFDLESLMVFANVHFFAETLLFLTEVRELKGSLFLLFIIVLNSKQTYLHGPDYRARVSSYVNKAQTTHTHTDTLLYVHTWE